MHRPDSELYLASSDDLLTWTDHGRIMQPQFEWEATKIGGDTRRIGAEKGWLFGTDGVDENLWDPPGVMPFGLDDPTKVIARQEAHPGTTYWLGVGRDVNNVVLTCGAVSLDRELWVSSMGLLAGP